MSSLKDQFGTVVRKPIKYLYMSGEMSYQAEEGQAKGLHDRKIPYEYFREEMGEEEFEQTFSDHYEKWIGVFWSVNAVFDVDKWTVITGGYDASKIYSELISFGKRHKIRVDDRIHIDGYDSAVTDMMRDIATESMAPKFFVRGDSLDRRGEKYIREDDLPF